MLSIDGMHIEINPTPNDCREAAARRVKEALVELRSILKGEYIIPTAITSKKFNTASFRNFSPEDLKMGCKPSYNSYSKNVSKLPKNAEKIRFRSAGGHMHFGYEKIGYLQHFSKNINYGEPVAIWIGNSNLKSAIKIPSIHTSDKEIIEIFSNHYKTLNPKQAFVVRGTENITLSSPETAIKYLDIIIGVPITMLENDAQDRRRIYGRAGEYRLPSYGLEYRVPSSMLIRDPRLYTMFLGWARLALGIAKYKISKYKTSSIANAIIAELDSIKNSELQKAINTGDKKLLKNIFEKGIGYICKTETTYFGNNSTNRRVLLYFMDIIIRRPSYIFDASKIFNNWLNFEGQDGIDSSVSRQSQARQNDIKSAWSNYAS